jgi:hypothetical protein
MMIRRIVVVAACLVTVAACASDPGEGIATAGGGGGSEAGPSPTLSLSDEERALKFAECMREQGIDMPDPQVAGPGGGGPVVAGGRIGGPGQSTEEIQAALEACRQYAAIVDGGAPLDPAAQEQLLRFAQCMRDHGVESFPDPQGRNMVLSESVVNDPDFPAAQEACVQGFAGATAVDNRGGRS